MNQRPHDKNHEPDTGLGFETAPLDAEDSLGVDDADIPAYRERPARTAPPPGPSIYELAGRAKPQHIPARKPEPEPEPEPVPEAEVEQEPAVVSDAAAGTPIVEKQTRPAARPDHRTDALLSDAPTTAYDPVPVEEPDQATTVFPVEDAESVEAQTSEYADPAAATSPEGVPATDTAVAVVPAQRGTTDFGLLILRVVLGVFLAGEAITRFFMLGGSTGLNGLTEQFAGYGNPQVLAVVVPGLQLLAGAFLVLGLITPLGSALAIAATGVTVLHGVVGNGNTQDAVLLALLLFAVSVAVAFTGPGRYGCDYARGWAVRPRASAWVAALVGIAGAVAVWFFLGGGF